MLHATYRSTVAIRMRMYDGYAPLSPPPASCADGPGWISIILKHTYHFAHRPPALRASRYFQCRSSASTSWGPSQLPSERLDALDALANQTDKLLASSVSNGLVEEEEFRPYALPYARTKERIDELRADVYSSRSLKKNLQN
ncbi:hypothetical protein GY45DRAFT_751299 [Cubamyces sp. BRFM 1775]|nr:hypothetical protein GY45DRAFT_751299 [Cubamyces sp. BRFM 1775]